MKKNFFFAICIIAVTNIFANPLPSARIEISELYFDNQGKWVLELAYNYPNSQIEKMVIYSSTDSIIFSGVVTGNSGVLVYREDSVSTPFHINRDGDSLMIKSKILDFPEAYDILVFGNYPNAVIKSPRSNQSICKYQYQFVKDNSPTIGKLNNDTIGICGTLSGVIYDKNLMPISNQLFYYKDSLKTNEMGHYSIRVLSNSATITEFYYWKKDYPWKSIKIDAKSYDMEPDSVIIRNIYLIEDMETGLKDVFKDDSPFKLYPNPLSISDNLHYEIGLPIKTTDCIIEVLNTEGKIILTKKINESTGELLLKKVNGLVLVNFIMNDKILSTKQILINHE